MIKSVKRNDWRENRAPSSDTILSNTQDAFQPLQLS
jgi:hypothetical protein